MSARACFDCAGGACRLCAGRTWDEERGEVAICPCWVTHEKEVSA